MKLIAAINGHIRPQRNTNTICVVVNRVIFHPNKENIGENHERGLVMMTPCEGGRDGEKGCVVSDLLAEFTPSFIIPASLRSPVRV